MSAAEAAIREQEAISAEFYGEPGNRAAILACLKEDARLVTGFLKTIGWTGGYEIRKVMGHYELTLEGWRYET